MATRHLFLRDLEKQLLLLFFFLGPVLLHAEEENHGL